MTNTHLGLYIFLIWFFLVDELYLFLMCIYLFILWLCHSMWDLSSLARNRTHVLCGGSMAFQPLGLQGSPLGLYIYLGLILCIVWGELQIHFSSVIAKTVCSSMLRGPTLVLVKCLSTPRSVSGVSALCCLLPCPGIMLVRAGSPLLSSSSRASGLVQALCNPMDLLVSLSTSPAP